MPSTSITPTNVDLKLTYENAQRRFSCSSKRPSWKTLAFQVKDRFNLPEEFNLGLSYVDSGGEAVVLSSEKELEQVWPIITDGENERDADRLPPLRFTVVQLPSLRSLSANTTASGTILDDSDLEDDIDGLESINSEDNDSAIEIDNDEKKDDKDDEEKKKTKKSKKSTSLQEDIHSFIQIVKGTVQDNESIKKACDKVLSHVCKKPDNGDKEGSEDALENAAVIREETGDMGAMTAGIVSALLAPALMGPPHRPPPPNPHFGGPPRHPYHRHGGHHGGRHHPHGPPHPHFGPPPPPPPPPHSAFFGGGHRFKHPDAPTDEDFDTFYFPHFGPHGFRGRPHFPGIFKHGKDRGCPYNMPSPPPHHHTFPGMKPGFAPFGGRHGPLFEPRRHCDDPHPEDSRSEFFRPGRREHGPFFGEGPGPHRHGGHHDHHHHHHRHPAHGRHTRFPAHAGRDEFDDLRGGFEAMRMDATAEDPNSSSSDNNSDIEFIDVKHLDAPHPGRGPPFGRRGPAGEGPHPPPPHHHHHHHRHHAKHEGRSDYGLGGRGHHEPGKSRRGGPPPLPPAPHGRHGDMPPPSPPHHPEERAERHHGGMHHHHHERHHARWA